jgi:hypothetical protein
VQRGRAAGYPAADDADVTIDAALQHRTLWRRARRGGVIGVDVGRASHLQGSDLFKIF